MPLFEIGDDELIPFRRVHAGPELYEQEIENLMWANLESFVGKPLFPVSTQPRVANGLRPDIVALDKDGHVHIIEVKRDIDRGQLAQCLEYAGWARSTSLDELAGLFHRGPEEFFPAWMEFTETESPQLVQRPPQIVLVARDIDGRTDAALSYLTENDLPVTVLKVIIYQDTEGRRFIDVGADHEIELPVTPTTARKAIPVRYEINGRRVEVGDLIDAGLLEVGETLTWDRPKVGDTYRARVGPAGQMELEDGRTFSSPSRAVIEAANINAYDGWHAWRTVSGSLLADLRSQLLERDQQDLTTPPE